MNGPQPPRPPEPASPKPGRPRPSPRAARPPPAATSPSSSNATIWVAAAVVLGGSAFWWSQQPRTLATPADQVQTISVMAPAPPAPLIASTSALGKATPAPLPVVASAPTSAPAMAPAAAPMTKAALAEGTPPNADPFAQPALFDPVAGRTPAALKRSEAALEAAFTDRKWTAYRTWLGAGLAAELKKIPDLSLPQNYDRVLKNPLFYQALLEHTLLQRLPENAQSLLSEDQGGRDFFTWLLKTPDATEGLLSNLRPEDQAREVLRIWAGLAVEDDEARGKYRELALAVALVFDQPFRPEWNSQTLEISPKERYNYYKIQNERGQLAARVNRYAARDLVWVVADPVPLSEMEWARKKVQLRQKNWGDAYGMIKYDMEKAVTGQAKEAYNGYTFAEILDKGGICGDRSYFSAYTARANGIPAAIIGGDGPMGGHAWIRWMPEEERWAESGRIGGYAAGTTTDPQTGRRISEMEFVRRSDAKEASPARTLTAQRFLWLADLHGALSQQPQAAVALEFALRTSPRLAVAWDAKLAFWKAHRRDEPVAEWEELVKELKKRFSDDKVMLTTAQQIQEQFVFPRQTVRDSLQDLKKDLRKFQDPRTSDESRDVGLLVANYQRQGQLLATAAQWDSVHQLYRKALAEYGGNTAAWRPLARDYFAFFTTTPEKEKAARNIESSYERYVETQTLNWFDVGSQNSAHALVADCWKACGDDAKVVRIQKEMERRTKRAKREAL